MQIEDGPFDGSGCGILRDPFGHIIGNRDGSELALMVDRQRLNTTRHMRKGGEWNLDAIRARDINPR